MPAISTVSWLSVVTVPAVCTLCYASNRHILLLVCVTVPAISTLCCLSLWLCQQSLHCADCHNVYIVLVVWLCQQSLHCAGCLWRCQQSLHCADWVTLLAISTLCCLSGWLISQQFLPRAGCHAGCHVMSTFCWLPVRLSHQYPHLGDYANNVYIVLVVWVICQQYLCCAGSLGDYASSLCCAGFLKLCQQCLHLGDCASNVPCCTGCLGNYARNLSGCLGDHASNFYSVLRLSVGSPGLPDHRASHCQWREEHKQSYYLVS